MVARARTLMRSQMADADLTLGDIAHQLYVSPRQLQRAFASVGSPGFRSELSGIRVREAAWLMHRNPRHSVATVAAAVGYRHPPFFAKTFRRQLGKPPGLWRRQCQSRLHDVAAARQLTEPL